MMFVDVCMKDAEELRKIAAHFDALGKKSNGELLRAVANRHKILARAYMTSVARYEREMNEWVERGRTEEEKAAALKWLEEMRGGSECRAGEEAVRKMFGDDTCAT